MIDPGLCAFERASSTVLFCFVYFHVWRESRHLRFWIFEVLNLQVSITYIKHVYIVSNTWNNIMLFVTVISRTLFGACVYNVQLCLQAWTTTFLKRLAKKLRNTSASRRSCVPSPSSTPRAASTSRSWNRSRSKSSTTWSRRSASRRACSEEESKGDDQEGREAFKRPALKCVQDELDEPRKVERDEEHPPSWTRLSPVANEAWRQTSLCALGRLQCQARSQISRQVLQLRAQAEVVRLPVSGPWHHPGQVNGRSETATRQEQGTGDYKAIEANDLKKTT